MSIRRVTLTLDASLRDLPALQGAARLAARLDAELRVLLIRDPGLLHFAALPVATEVTSGSARVRRLPPGLLERELERALSVCHEALQREFVDARTLPRTVEAASLEQLLVRAQSELLLVSRRSGHAPVRRDELGSIAARLIQSGPQPVLFFLDAPLAERTVAVLLEAGEPPALELALDLAQPAGRLCAIVHAPAEADYLALAARVREACAARGVALELLRVRAAHGALLAHQLRVSNSDLLVVGAGSRLLRDEDLPALLGALRLPIVVARTAA